MARFRRTPRTSGGLIAGWANIAAYFGRSIMTMRRWAKEQGFPVILMPGRDVMTSTGLIDLWLLSRMPKHDVSAAELGGAMAEMSAALQASPAALAKIQAAIDAAVQGAVHQAVVAGYAERGEAAQAARDAGRGAASNGGRAQPAQGAGQ